MCIIMGPNVFGQQQNVSGLLLTHFNRASGQAWEKKCSSTCVLPTLKTCCWFVVGVGTTLSTTAVLVYCLHLRAAADLSSWWVPHYQQRQWVSEWHGGLCLWNQKPLHWSSNFCTVLNDHMTANHLEEENWQIGGTT
jgi:hypothetical protein